MEPQFFSNLPNSAQKFSIFFSNLPNSIQKPPICFKFAQFHLKATQIFSNFAQKFPIYFNYVQNHPNFSRYC